MKSNEWDILEYQQFYWGQWDQRIWPRIHIIVRDNSGAVNRGTLNRYLNKHLSSLEKKLFYLGDK